jgi:hypothetical protein
MDNWRFFQSSSGYWLWQHTDAAGVQRVSDRYFGSRRDCLADATRHGFYTKQGTVMAEANDFSWSDESLIVVKRVDAIAVYKNPEGDIVIRQENRGNDEDSRVVVPPQYAYTLVESIQRMLKAQLFPHPVDSR